MEGTTTNRAEAERLLGIAEKLLQTKDYSGSKEFAVLAQETEPLLDGSDQILAIVDVLLAAQKRINNHHDWYSILHLDRRCDDLELIKKQYRRLALLLHPDKNKFALSDTAFKLVADAWAVLSNSGKKSLFDSELGLYSKVDLVAMKKHKEFKQPQRHAHDYNQQKLPVRRNSWVDNSGRRNPEKDATTSLWTACPYCYNLYEYPRAYDGYCLRCQNCQKAFTCVEIPTLPPFVPGKEAYYCCWAFFPIAVEGANTEAGKRGGFPNSMPPGFPSTGTTATRAAEVAPDDDLSEESGEGFVDVREGNVASGSTGQKKRGRPKKNVWPI